MGSGVRSWWRSCSLSFGLRLGCGWYFNKLIGIGLSIIAAAILGWPMTDGSTPSLWVANVALSGECLARLTTLQADYVGRTLGGVAVFVAFVLAGIYWAPYRQRNIALAACDAVRESRDKAARLGAQLDKAKPISTALVQSGAQLQKWDDDYFGWQKETTDIISDIFGGGAAAVFMSTTTSANQHKFDQAFDGRHNGRLHRLMIQHKRLEDLIMSLKTTLPAAPHDAAAGR